MFKKITAIIILGLSLVGCAHYNLGTGNKPAYHSISFAPVVNRSYAPRVHTLVSDALFRAFATGGGMAVASQGGADVTLKITITEFHKSIGAAQSNDTGRARSLALSLKANAVLVDQQGVIVYSGDFEVNQEVYADSGAVRAENEAMPQIADALAKKIYRAVVSSW